MVQSVVVDDSTPTPDQASAQQAHEDKMVASADADATGKPSPTADPAPMPEKGVEKFYNKDTGDYNWQAHAADAEFRLDQSKNDKAQAPADAATQPTPDADAQQAVADAGLDFNALSAEYAQNGELSDTAYEALEKGGIPRDMVDAYIDGQAAIRDNTREEVLSTIGGTDVYNEILAWAASSLSDAEKTAFNNSVEAEGVTIEQAQIAVRDLHNRYLEANGQEPNLIGGGVPAGEAYQSWEQVRVDMAKPAYAADPAFRAKVEARLAASNIA